MNFLTSVAIGKPSNQNRQNKKDQKLKERNKKYQGRETTQLKNDVFQPPWVHLENESSY